MTVATGLYTAFVVAVVIVAWRQAARTDREEMADDAISRANDLALRQRINTHEVQRAGRS